MSPNDTGSRPNFAPAYEELFITMRSYKITSRNLVGVQQFDPLKRSQALRHVTIVVHSWDLDW